MRASHRFLVFACIVSLLLLAFAQHNSITVTNSTMQAELPDTITFSLEVSSSADIKTITLFYQSNARSCQDAVARQDVEFEAGSQVEAEWVWELKYSGSMPPGAQLSWQWEIEDNAGNTLLTDLQTATIEDDVYDWLKLSEGEVSVWWVEGEQSFGRQMLDLALESLDRLETEVGVRPSRPVILVLYPNTASMQDALLFEPEWTGGIAFWEYGVVVIGLAPGEDAWAEEVIPHELAHVVTLELMFNCYGVQAPTWLVEGLAVHLEGPAKDYDVDALRTALDKGTLTPLHSLTSGFASDPSKVNLDYAHSGEVVRFLIDTYRPEKMAALLGALQSGKIFETALQETYHLSTDGVEAAWQQSWGYDVVIPTLEPTGASSKPQRTAVPTIALWTAVVQATATPTLTNTPLPPTATPTQPPSATPLPTELPATETSPIPTPTPRGARLPCGSVGLIPLGLVVFFTRHRKSHFIWPFGQ